MAFTVGSASCAGPPVAPVLLTPSVAPGLVTGTWLPPVPGEADTYHIALGTTPGASDLLAIETLSSATAVHASTPAPGTYYVTVHAGNACGISAASNSVALVVPPVTPLPAAPASFNAAVAGRTATLTWTAPAGARPIAYLVEAGSAPGLANYALIPVGAGATSLTVPGVPPGVYHVRVRAVTAGGAGPASNEVLLTVQ